MIARGMLQLALFLLLSDPSFALCSLGHYSHVGQASAVRDVTNGLIWSRCLTGAGGQMCHASPGAFTHAEAFAIAKKTIGWRLPTHDELMTLLQSACVPHINTVFFDKPTLPVWTDSPGADGDSSYWTVDFSAGFDDIADRSSLKAVRLVRSPAGR